MKKMLLICCGLALAVALQAQMIHVPANYPSIQQGINAATPGDTVLVAEGKYYEQINFKGKKPLMVASRFLIDGDTSHIGKTIIDGSQISNIDSATVVYFVSGEDTTSVLCGFTITKGKGTQGTDGGITYRVGGGVWIDGSGAKLIYNHITLNDLTDSFHGKAQYVGGAGLVCTGEMKNRWVVIDNNVIDHNSCFIQGIESDEQVGPAGLEVYSNSRITNNTISENTSTGKGTSTVFGSGLSIGTDLSHSNRINAIVRHNIIKNNRAESQNKYAVGAGGAFQAITGILSDNEITNNTTISAWGGGAGFYFIEPDSGLVVSKNVFKENTSNNTAGGIFFNYENTNIGHEVLSENNYFFGNSAKLGGAVFVNDLPVKLQNNVFSGNHATDNGGAIYLKRNLLTSLVHLATLINNSFSWNKAKYGGAITSVDSKPLIINSVFWGDSADYGSEIFLFGTDKAEIANTIINPSFITGPFIDGGGNLNTNPMFADADLLTLSPLSNCIDKGIVSFTCECGDKHSCPLYDITGTIRPQDAAVDMGAYEYSTVGNDDLQSQISDFGIGNYPNPFTGSTTFTYKLNESSQVKLQIYNNLGLLVAELVSEFQQSGEHKVNWNAESLLAGIYFYRLQSGGNSVSGKIIILK